MKYTIKEHSHLVDYVELIPDSVVVVDRHGTISLVNRLFNRMFGYGRMELVGRSLSDLLPLRLRAQHEDHVTGFFKSPTTRPMGIGLDLYALHKDGREIPVDINLRPVVLHGEVVVVSALRNMSYRKQVEADLKRQAMELERSNHDLMQYAHLVAHELRRPLSVMNA